MTAVLKLRDETGLKLPTGQFLTPPKIDCSVYKEHIKVVVNDFNKSLHVAGFKDVLFECDEILACSDRQLASNDAICRFISGQCNGKIWENTILNCVDTLKIVRDCAGKSIVFHSPMLSGKTTYSHALQLMLLPVIHFIRDVPYWGIRLVPNKCGLEDQSLADYKKFCQLYDGLHIRMGSTILTLREYQVKMSGYFDLNNFAECEDLFVKRINKNSREEIFKILERVYQKQGNGLFIVDEPDYGSKFESELHKILNLSKDLHDRHKGDMLIGTTATEKELSNEEHIVHQKGNLYASYCGPNCTGGDYIDPDFPDLPSPEIYNHADFSQEMGLSGDLAYVWPSYYEDSVRFEKHLKRQEKCEETGRSEPPHDIWLPTTSHDEYQELCESAIIEYLETVLIKNNYKGMPGAAIRFVNSNTSMQAFAEILKKALPEVQILEYNDGRNKVSFETFLKRHRNEQSYFAILVTGSFRMGDYVSPNTIGYWLEFAESVTMRAILQGFYGRCCGANKGNPPAAWVAKDRTANALQVYIDSKGKINLLKFCERTEVADNDPRSFVVYNDTICPTCKKFLNLLEHHAVSKLGNGFYRDKFRGGGMNVENEYEEFKKHVAQYHNRRLLGVRETVRETIGDKIMNCGMKKHGDLPFFSCYKLTSKADQRGTANDRTDRLVDPRGANVTKVNEILFSLLWLKKDNKRKTVAVDNAKFRCVPKGADKKEQAKVSSSFIMFSAERRGVQDAQNGIKPKDNPYDSAKYPQQNQEWLQGYNSVAMAR
jgi:hypothetical protein